MGQVNTEQVAIIIEETADAIAKNKMKSEPNMNFSYLLLLAVIPVILGWWLNRRKK
jgi:hypothetical protein